MKQKLFLLLAISFATGCCCEESKRARMVTTAAPEPRVIVKEAPENRWEETMHDTIDVPGQIDPTGTYYRAPHKTVVEIRPGKHQDVTYTGER